MTVATELGLDDYDLEQEIKQAWPSWTRITPDLACFETPENLFQQLTAADREAIDEALHSLARLAAQDGGDDLRAARALAWLLLPTAISVASRHADLTPQIDHAVAAELWIQVRTFSWRTRRKVAGNLKRDLWHALLRQHGRSDYFARLADRVWSNTDLVETSTLAAVPDERITPAREELLDVLDWACQQGVITDDDRHLLLRLVDAAGDLPRASTAQGLLSNRATQEVGRLCGLTDRQVRRRARQCLAALSSAAPAYRRSACA